MCVDYCEECEWPNKAINYSNACGHDHLDLESTSWQRKDEGQALNWNACP